MSNGPAVLALNCGSSSLKFGVYDNVSLRLICEGEAEEIGGSEPTFWISIQGGARKEQKVKSADHGAAFGLVARALNDASVPEPCTVGHRIVHGGPAVRDHVLLTPDITEQLQRAVEFAPLHVPTALAVLGATQTKWPGVPQVACLDTAFHRTLSDVSRTLPLPADLRKIGLQRYGFHGLSLESILEQLNPVPERLIVAHLGNGSSITAIRDGRSVDTTMGFTPNAGVLMGTRSGDLDPGVLTYLMRHRSAGPDELEDILNHHSGLLGVSETSSDVRHLSELRGQDRRADLALRMFCHQVRKAIAGMAAVLDGVDSVVFTGGIGEHAEDVRKEILTGLAHLGSFETVTLPAQEDLQIARIAARLASSSQSLRK